MLFLYDKLYRKARRCRGDAAQQVFAFCRALEGLLRDRYDLDLKALEGSVLDLYDPILTWRENLEIVKRELHLDSPTAYDEDYEVYLQVKQLEEYLEYASPEERGAIEKELRVLRARLARLRSRRPRSRRAAGRERYRLSASYALRELRLREYQQEAVRKWLERRRGVVVLPTGAGKTYIALGVIKRLRCRTLIVVPTVPLLRQWKERLEEYVTPRAGVYYGDAKKIRYYTVTTYQSLCRRPELAEKFDLVVFDEVHHLAAPSYSKILDHLPRMVLGLTATPQRFDGREHIFLRALGGVVYRAGFAEVGAWLARLVVVPVVVKLSTYEMYRYARLRSALSRIASLAAEEGDEEEGEVHLRAMLSVLARIKLLLSEAPSKLSKAADILKGFRGERVLVFSESVRSLEKLKELLDARGVPAAVFHYKKRDLSVIKRWGRDFDVLLSCRALEEGLDVPNCAVGLIISGGLSPRQIIQRVGRLLRPKEKNYAVLYVMAAQGTYETRLLRKITSIARQLQTRRLPHSPRGGGRMRRVTERGFSLWFNSLPTPYGWGLTYSR